MKTLETLFGSLIFALVLACAGPASATDNLPTKVSSTIWYDRGTDECITASFVILTIDLIASKEYKVLRAKANASLFESNQCTGATTNVQGHLFLSPKNVVFHANGGVSIRCDITVPIQTPWGRTKISFGGEIVPAGLLGMPFTTVEYINGLPTTVINTALDAKVKGRLAIKGRLLPKGTDLNATVYIQNQ